MNSINTMAFVYFIAFIALWSTPALSVSPDCASSSSNPPGYEQIDHSHIVSNGISDLYLEERLSDVVLKVNNEKFYAHRVVLASLSSYFSSLLYGEYLEARECNVSMSEASAASFKVLLKYIYSGRLDLSILESNIVLELLILSNKFGFSNLQFSIIEYLRKSINADNASSLYAVAQLYQFKELEVDSLNFINVHTLDVLQSKDSLALTPEAFQLFLNRDTAYANELDIFLAVCRWIKKNQDKLVPGAKTNMLSAIRYQLMSDEELSEVRRSELVFSDTIILDVIKSRTESLIHAFTDREKLVLDVNFVPNEHYNQRSTQFNGGTMIMLDRPWNINYIEIVLWKPDSRSYSYYIEVSLDKLKWLRVIDHSNYHCHYIQRLWIHRQFVQYIRVVGTNDTSNKTFTFLRVMYNTVNRQLVEIKNGFVAPKYNVASHYQNAILTKGEVSGCFSSGLLLDDYAKYSTNLKMYTYHSLKSGCIEVQLAQPYVLSSMRLLFWDDYRHDTYGYIIQVSVNSLDWDVIVDKSNEPGKSWQLFEFEARLVVYIRIIGVYSSNDDGKIKCVYLEAPAQVQQDSDVVPLQP